jgi:hypothetical protein
MANATGGKYFGNINNYEKHLEKIQNLTSFYYVLGYYIDERWDGKYHEIKVEVRRPGCEVHAQKGYLNPKPFIKYSNLEKTLHLFDLVLSEKPIFQTPLRFPLAALPCSARGKPNLSLFSRIPREIIQDLDGKEVEIIEVVFDKENNVVKFDRIIKDFSKLPEKNIYYCASVSLPPGEYQCRLVLRNLETGKGAVASVSIVIPKDQGYGIKLYPPLLLIKETGTFFLKEPSPAYPFDKTQYSPLVEEFEEGTKNLWVMVRCSFFGIQQPDIKLSANFINHLTGSGKVIPSTLSFLNKYWQDDIIIFLIELQTEGLWSGEYFLNLFAEETNSKSSSHTNSFFKVK